MLKQLFITCPKGIEGLLQEEASKLGAIDCKQKLGGITCEASLDVIYQICLWSRLANRVLLLLFSGPIESSKACYQLCSDYLWPSLLKANSTLCVNFNGKSSFIRNEMYGAQLVKDAIVDSIRNANNSRPDIKSQHADCTVHARLRNNELTVYYDLSGHSLHQRGYREKGGFAPLKENLAAALLYRGGWEKLAAEKAPLIDPCCGSGTLLIEAMMMATDKAPGLNTQNFGFLHWQDHDAKCFKQIKGIAQERYKKGLAQELPLIFGFDQEPKAIHIAKENIQKAGFGELIKIKQRSLKDFAMPIELQNKPGLLICNPPYGERVKESSELIPLYQELGLALSQHCQAWKAAILTSEKGLAKAMGLRAYKQYAFFNGTIACKLYLLELTDGNKSSLTSASSRSQMMINRLKKNNKALKSWRNKKNIKAYRIYDADIPEYACAIDIYNDWALVQEYAAPKDIPKQKTEQRVLDVIQAIPLALDISHQHVVAKQRKKQKGKEQYERHAQTGHRLIIEEGHAKYIVNLKDYLDTGLFLDHRPIRQHIFDIAKNKTFLNLFCYTATVSVQAALGRAKQTTSVDMSRTYLQWAKDNFKENKLKLHQHEFIQANCVEWIKQCNQKFDIIFLDPPSFSNSKRMEDTLDIQRDHEALIYNTQKLLKPGGELYFSTNFRKFKLAPDVISKYIVIDITKKTIDKDFERNSKIHHCFCIKQKPTSSFNDSKREKKNENQTP